MYFIMVSATRSDGTLRYEGDVNGGKARGDMQFISGKVALKGLCLKKRRFVWTFGKSNCLNHVEAMWFLVLFWRMRIARRFTWPRIRVRN